MTILARPALVGVLILAASVALGGTAQAATTSRGAESDAQCGDCEPGPSPFTCYETDGYAPHLKGTLYFYYYGTLVGLYTDYCSTSGTLVEYWCNSSSTWTTTTFYCTNGCSNGRCL